MQQPYDSKTSNDRSPLQKRSITQCWVIVKRLFSNETLHFCALFQTNLTFGSVYCNILQYRLPFSLSFCFNIKSYILIERNPPSPGGFPFWVVSK